MSDTKSNCSNHTNKADQVMLITNSNTKRRMSITSKLSHSSQESADTNNISENTISSKRFVLWSRRVLKMIEVRRKMSNYKSQPLTVNENYTETGYSDDFLKKVDKSDYPTYPRFPATMSIEAQYSFLKGYQDLISSQLKHINLPKTERLVLPKLENEKFLRLEPKIKMKSNYTSFIPYTSSNKIDNIALPTPLQQFSTTYRLQNAIDILDHINNNNGRCTFSNHYRRHNIVPVPHFEEWKKMWTNDFEVHSQRN